MSFQFQCPHCNNILEGDPSQAGQQCQCPICSQLFIVPAPVAPAAPTVAPMPEIPIPRQAAPEPREPFPAIQPSADPSPKSPPAPANAPAVLVGQEPELLHIPCPECKKILETPVEMLDQEVLCPHCHAQFRLRRRDSVEFKRKLEQQEALKERKASRFWFNWAIVAVVLVVIFLLFLILSSGAWG